MEDFREAPVRLIPRFGTFAALGPRLGAAALLAVGNTAATGLLRGDAYRSPSAWCSPTLWVGRFGSPTKTDYRKNTLILTLTS